MRGMVVSLTSSGPRRRSAQAVASGPNLWRAL
jgi:hypothetical protein